MVCKQTDVFDHPSTQVVKHRHTFPTLQLSASQVRTNKPSTAGDQTVHGFLRCCVPTTDAGVWQEKPPHAPNLFFIIRASHSNHQGAHRAVQRVPADPARMSLSSLPALALFFCTGYNGKI